MDALELGHGLLRHGLALGRDLAQQRLPLGCGRRQGRLELGDVTGGRGNLCRRLGRTALGLGRPPLGIRGLLFRVGLQPFRGSLRLLSVDLHLLGVGCQPLRFLDAGTHLCDLRLELGARGFRRVRTVPILGSFAGMRRGEDLELGDAGPDAVIHAPVGSGPVLQLVDPGQHGLVLATEALELLRRALGPLGGLVRAFLLLAGRVACDAQLLER